MRGGWLPQDDGLCGDCRSGFVQPRHHGVRFLRRKADVGPAIDQDAMEMFDLAVGLRPARTGLLHGDPELLANLKPRP